MPTTRLNTLTPNGLVHKDATLSNTTATAVPLGGDTQVVAVKNLGSTNQMTFAFAETSAEALTAAATGESVDLSSEVLRGRPKGAKYIGIIATGGPTNAEVAQGVFAL